MDQLSSLFSLSPLFNFFFNTKPPFPHFRLPQLAYKTVIDLMTPPEQVSLSLCSQRTYSIIKSVRHKPRLFELWISGRDRIDYVTGFHASTDVFRGCRALLSTLSSSPDFDPLETVMIRGHRVPAQMFTREDGRKYLETFWDDQMFGLRMIGDHVCDLFDIDLCGLLTRKDFRNMVDWVSNRQSSIESLEIVGPGKCSDEDFRHIILNCNCHDLYGNLSPSRNFWMVHFRKKFRTFSMENCHWITIDNLMTMDCVYIHASGKKFSHLAVNRFLNHWINGGSPNLKFLRFQLKRSGEVELLRGLEDYVIHGIPGFRTYST
uniref:FBA_2 domain-containing protein n=1 Tax=Caenorhabditis tropicalis TaxID=1561998 RepID=A0A1I7T6F8_9PELO